jgi:hypothetical protein
MVEPHPVAAGMLTILLASLAGRTRPLSEETI